MTTAVVVMNSAAVALAADSALTVLTPSNRWTITGQRKIFPVLDDPPVAVAVTGSMRFCGVPWSSLLAAYSGSLRRSTEPLERLQDVARSFAAFLTGDPRLDDAAWDVERTSIMTDLELVPDAEADEAPAVARVAARAPTDPASASTLVVSGFGREDLRPSAVELSIRVDRERASCVDVTAADGVREPYSAAVLALGQTEEIDAFLTGIHPDVVPARPTGETADVTDALVHVSTLLRDAARTDEERDFVMRLIPIVLQGAVEHRRLDAIQARRRSQDLRGAMLAGLGVLPKQTLAQVAHGIVAQAVLRRSLNPYAEASVGGAVEALVLSRDGGCEYLRQESMAPTLRA